MFGRNIGKIRHRLHEGHVQPSLEQRVSGKQRLPRPVDQGDGAAGPDDPPELRYNRRRIVRHRARPKRIGAPDPVQGSVGEGERS